MKKFTKMIAGITAAVMTMGIAGCTEGSGASYPAFINPTTAVGNENNQTSEKYVVNVRSEGGLPLDGVTVAAKRGGTVIKRGISKNGKIELGVALGEYDLEIDGDSLPAGYYLPSATYKTNPSKRDEVDIGIPSKIIESGSAASSFAVGSIMKDFTFVDTDGVSHRISEILKEKKAVALNFFFTKCGPCQAEFPAINTAYQGNNDIELLAITHATNEDGTKDNPAEKIVADFKADRGLTFPMGVDTIGLTSAFNVGNFPTTIIIDRYGLIAYRSSGTDTSESSWRRLFTRFTSANYVQSLDGSGGDENNPGGSSSGSLVKPDKEMPATSVMKEAASPDIQGATYSEDESEYSWPWVTGNDESGSFIYASNTGIDNSYSIVYIDIPMKAGQVLSFEYFVSSEPKNGVAGDVFNVLLDGSAMNGLGWSGEIGWTSYDVYVADRDKTVQLAFAYIKDSADPTPEEGEENTCKDTVRVRNIRLADSSAIDEPLDVMRPCAYGEKVGYAYSDYVKAVKGDDGFYHKDTKDGALIYITISNITPWSELRGNNITQELPNDEGVIESTTYPATLSRMTANNYYNSSNATCIIGDKDVYQAYKTYVLIQGYMPAPYYLMPVNDLLKEWADLFVKDFATADYTENSWLEFCFYYDHYGSENNRHDGGETCNVDVDYTEGLTRFNAYQAHLGLQKAEIRFPLQLAHNGTYYRFTAETAGVYQLRSYTTGCSSAQVSPGLSIYDENGNYLLSGAAPRNAERALAEFTVDAAGRPLDVYEGFNGYIRLNAGQTVYLYLEVTPGATGYYNFEITNRGEEYRAMLLCSTDNGAWAGGSTYTAIRVALNPDDNCYYKCDRNGDIRLDQPVYVDMLRPSCLISNNTQYNNFPLKTLIDDDFFTTFVDEDSQSLMERYLGEALAKSESDPLYGMIQATADFADVINRYYDAHLFGGRGDGRGWLAFCVYTEYFD